MRTGVIAKILNKWEQIISPSTEEKQDTIISELDLQTTELQNIASNTSQSVMSVENAINEEAYNLNAAAFDKTTNITTDYILDNIELNFSTAESKTITITTSKGTEIWSETNTQQNIVLSNINMAMNANDNIRVQVTQFSSAGTMDCILKIKKGSNTLVGNPSVLLLDGYGNPIGSLNGGLNIHHADVHTTPFLHNVKILLNGDSTLSVQATMGATSITLVDATNFDVGNYVDIYNGSSHIHKYYRVTSKLGNVLTLNMPLDYTHPSGSVVKEISFSMNVNGSITPVSFFFTPSANEVVHITGLNFIISSSAAADDTKFGGLTALANGVIMRINRNNGESYENITHWRRNLNFKEDMINVDYTDKAGGGNYGVDGHWLFTDHEYIIRLDGSNNDKIEFLIQDDLSTLVDYRLKLQGHFEG